MRAQINMDPSLLKMMQQMLPGSAAPEIGALMSAGPLLTEGAAFIDRLNWNVCKPLNTARVSQPSSSEDDGPVERALSEADRKLIYAETKAGEGITLGLPCYMNVKDQKALDVYVDVKDTDGVITVGAILGAIEAFYQSELTPDTLEALLADPEVMGSESRATKLIKAHETLIPKTFELLDEESAWVVQGDSIRETTNEDGLDIGLCLNLGTKVEEPLSDLDD